MTEAPPRPPSADPRELRRSSQGRILMGVCAGLGRHTGIDPVVFRVGFVVLLLGSGVGLFVYLAAFLLMKEPNGRPGFIEHWTRRDFDAETVMALLTAVLGFGLAINLMTVWLDTATLAVGVLLAVSLLAAHSHGVDLLALARSMPERLTRKRSPERPAASYTETPPPAPVRSPEPDPAPPTTAVRTPQPQPRQAEPPAPQAAPVAHAAEPQAPPHDQAAPEAVTAEYQVPPPEPPAYRADPPPAYRADPPTAVDYGTQAAPFAPNGPYQPLDPARRAGQSPYDPALYSRPLPRRERRPKSYIGAITLLLAFIVGGIIVLAQSKSAAGVSPTIVGGAMLIAIGAGLLIAAWWGRGAGLVAIGTVVALLVGMGLMFGGVPRNVGTSEWVPASVAEASRLYDVGVGDGLLDLSELELAPGSTVTFNAAVSAGELVVIVPPTARVEVHARNKVGDIQIDRALRGGVDVRFNQTLEPEVQPEGVPATIVLNLRGGVGDMEVRRGA